MSDADFEAFWACYPRKVAKLAAKKAYDKARLSATQEELLEGVAQYIQHKPEYCDWAHAASWLNAGRWMDDYTPPKIEKPKTGAYQTYVPFRLRKEA
jgi:hypothetical protein